MKTLLKILFVIVACMTAVAMLPYVLLSTALVVIYALIVRESIIKAIDDIVSETRCIVDEIVDKIRGF